MMDASKHFDNYVSIITPTFNSHQMLRNTMNSIINQTSLNFEWIVISGDNSIETLSVLKDFDESKLTFILQEPNGVYDAIKTGFEAARYPVIYWINAGDILMPYAIGSVLHEVKQSNINWWIGSSSLMNKDIKLVRVDPPFLYKSSYIINGFCGKHLPWIQQESVFFRKELLNLVDLEMFSKFKYAGDYFLFYSFAKSGIEPKSLGYVIASFSKHDGQISENQLMYWNEVFSFTGYYILNVIGNPILFIKSILSLLYFFIQRLLPSHFDR